jgi:hypothetical protein
MSFDTIDDEQDTTSSFALFEGDAGTLDEPERRALVALLKNRYVSARSHAAEWRTIADAEGTLRSRLNDLFLDLFVDHEREVAYKRQARSESTRRPFPTLLHDTAYTREETILLVYLRSRLRADARPEPDAVVVDRTEILAHAAGFRPVGSTDRTRDDGRVAKAVERLLAARVLLRTSDPDRFRVASVLEVLLPLERLAELDAWLRAQTAAPHATDETDASMDGLEARGGPAPSLQIADSQIEDSETDTDGDEEDEELA